MFLFVICFNVGLTLLNCYLAVQLWLSYGKLKRLTRTLTRLEKCSHRYLRPIPPQGRTVQQGTQALRSRYRWLVKQWLFLENLLFLIRLGSRLGRRV